MSSLSRATKYALWVALGYLAFGSAYIVLSSSLAANMSTDVETLEELEKYKGVAYIALTSLGVFFAARWALRLLEARTLALVRSEQALVANERRVMAGLLASCVAHDANNVLTVLSASLAQLKSDGADTAELDHHVRRSLDQLVELNRRLVQLARSRTQTAIEDVELGQVVREVVELLNGQRAVRSAQIAVEAAEEVRLPSSPVLLTQIVANLVTNAAEAKPGAAIALKLRRDGDAAVIEVHDDGPGVPEARREHLFVALTTTKADGNGLGLFSVRACAHALGGDVEVTGSPLGGAQFRVTLPLRGPPAAPA